MPCPLGKVARNFSRLSRQRVPGFGAESAKHAPQGWVNYRALLPLPGKENGRGRSFDDYVQQHLLKQHRIGRISARPFAIKRRPALALFMMLVSGWFSSWASDPAICPRIS